MKPSDDFKAQLKAGNIPEALALALNGAVDLKITTWVTSATDPQSTAPGKRLRTRINTIEGKVDNEVGDQFIGNGPYRELRQFHIDQVSQGNEIIHNNLKSLQTLFEVVIAMQQAQRRINTLPPSTLPFVLEPSSEVEQLLAPAQDSPEPLTVTEPAAEVEELAPTPDSLTDSVLPALALGGVAATVLNRATPAPEVLEEEEEDDDHWDDSVLDLLESLPVGEPTELEEMESPEAEDWRDFIEEENAPDPPKLDLDGPIGQDWGILTQEDFEPPQTAKEPLAFQEDLGELIKDESEAASTEAMPEAQNWEKLNFEDLQPPPVAALPTDETASTEVDDDWGDLVEDEPLLPPSQPVPSLDSLNLEAEDEWDDWVMDSEPLQDSPLKRLESLDLEDDSEWDDFEENADPFAAPPTNLASSLDDDADWDNFAVDVESYTGLLELDTNLGAGFDLSGDFEGLTDDSKDNYLSGLSKPSAKDANDLMEVLFGDEPQDFDAQVKKTEEELFADMQFEEFLANGNSPEDELKVIPELEPQDAKDDLGQPPSVEKVIIPPPPPPSHLPNQSN